MGTTPETAGRSPDALPEKEILPADPRRLVKVRTGMELYASMPGGPAKKEAAVRVYREMEGLAANALNSSKSRLEMALDAARTNVKNMPAEFADLKEYILDEVLPGLKYDVPPAGKDVDDDAPYLDRSGRLEIGELTGIRQRIQTTLHSPFGSNPAVSAGLRCTLEALDAYEQRQNQLLCSLRPNVDQMRLQRVSQTEGKENFVFKLAFVALAGILGTTTLAISVLSKGEKNFKAPAIYFGLAAAAAMGKKWLAPSDVADAAEIVNAVGTPGGTFETITGKYGMGGKAWLDVVKKIRTSIDLADETLNPERVMTILNPDPSIKDAVAKFVKNKADFELFVNFLQTKGWSERTEKFMDGMIEQKITGKYVLNTIRGLPPALPT